MGGPNLEIFKFGMYIAFPIGWMYYFGTNLDHKFSIPDFWPKPNQMHKIPFEKDDINQELERLKNRRLALRRARLEQEGLLGGDGEESGSVGEDLGVSVRAPVKRGGILDRLAEKPVNEREDTQRTSSVHVESRKGWLDWAKGR
ncbi:hypothetical protein EJ08DRAFT_736238 [Tothia fuscella]|uniref:Mitochondrial cytochrome c oxidase assembly factor n=1 Tax=Tothia fuscella TaxID=1048955 RepID=A0A9P4NM75_9PEZI|nr:hypothetical protein EJ08DRAFT_736238 [Tothia fuscella]